jgi:hypothetical protein
MVHELARYDPLRIPVVLRWPLREAMLAYVNQLKREALDSWRHAELCYVAVAPHSTKPGNPPKAPRILRRFPTPEHRRPGATQEEAHGGGE